MVFIVRLIAAIESSTLLKFFSNKFWLLRKTHHQPWIFGGSRPFRLLKPEYCKNFDISCDTGKSLENLAKLEKFLEIGWRFCKKGWRHMSGLYGKYFGAAPRWQHDCQGQPGMFQRNLMADYCQDP